jgi:hypothetical protein
MPEFNRGHGQIVAAGMDATRATARLPGFDIEIVHRPPIEDDADQIYINLRAAPSFEAFGRALEAANPFAFWARVAQPHLAAVAGAACALALPWTLALPRASGDGASRSAQEVGSPG